MAPYGTAWRVASRDAPRWRRVGTLSLNESDPPQKSGAGESRDVGTLGPVTNEDSGMKKSRFTEEQFAYALKQAEQGTAVGEICRKMGIAEATFYVWRKKYGGLGPSELKRLRLLEVENRKLKQLVADLSLDKAMLQEVVTKKL